MLSSALLSPEYQVEEDSSLKATSLDIFTNLGFWIYRPDQLLPIPSTISGDQPAQLSVLVPQRHLCYTNPNVLERKLWGTGIYTDDSDLVAVLLHSGSIKPTFPHPLLQDSPPSEKQQQQEIWNGMMVDYYGKTEGEALVKACQSFPLFTTTEDLLVNVCVLSCLREYPGTVQNYIKSRSWGLNEPIHHGLSIKILSVQSLEVAHF